jgi:alcohol dehydrogenase
MSSTFFIPAVNIMGIGCLDEAMDAIRQYGFRKAFIVTDAGLAKAGVASMIAGKLALQDIDSVIFDGAKPNPSIANVEHGLGLLKETRCDFVVSLGGARPTTVPRDRPVRDQRRADSRLRGRRSVH